MESRPTGSIVGYQGQTHRGPGQTGRARYSQQRSFEPSVITWIWPALLISVSHREETHCAAGSLLYSLQILSVTRA